MSVIKSRRCLIIFILAICFCLFTPWLLTRPAFLSLFDFSDKGQIGDTIGGITAPFIGIVSICLLISTLNEQILFNKQQASDNTISQILNMQTAIIQMDERFSYTYLENSGDCKSGEGISSLALVSVSGSNYYTYKIEIRQARFILSQLSVFTDLCKCYAALIKKAERKEEAYSSFLSSYQITLSEFLECVSTKNIIVGNTLDNASDDNNPSEIEAIKKDAKRILELVKTL